MSGALADPVAPALLAEGRGLLAAAGLATARQDAEWLLAAVLGVPRLHLWLERGRPVGAGAVQRYRALLERRAAHEPLQHLLGFEEFCGLRLRVTPDALIPRPETEGLAQWAVELVRDRAPALAADLGTGSGAIACALAAALPRAEVLAVERSARALEVARANVAALGLGERVRLLAGDLYEPLGPWRGRLDLVIANPPYLPSAGIPQLPREVRDFEPRAALDGGPDGMAVLRRVVLGAPAMLQPGAWLLLEIGLEQAGPLASLMAAEGFGGIEARRDLAGVERYLAGCLGATPAPARRRGC